MLSTAWSIFVIAGTVVSLLGFFLILMMNRHTSNPGETTGHEYDGIEEYDNPLPAWWFQAFLLSIVFAIGYLAWYPGLGNFPGISGWTSVGELEASQEEARAKFATIYARYGAMSVDELVNDPAAMKMGRRLFSNNCAVCHGVAAIGSYGFPNLTDDEWIWGRDDADINTTITGGRIAAMPPWEAVLDNDQVMAVTEFVVSLGGGDTDEALVDAGRPLFGMYCATCHMGDGNGNKLFGAPRLRNDIWLYGGSRDEIALIIRKGRGGQMPAFLDRLGEDKVQILTAYVKSLSAEGNQ